MLVYLNTNLGIIEAEVIDEDEDECMVRINNTDIWVNKVLCDLKKPVDDDNKSLHNNGLDFFNNDVDINDDNYDDIDTSDLVYNPNLQADIIADKVKTEKNNEVKVMSVKERILEKLDYKIIAEKVYDLLGEELTQYVADRIDEDYIAENLVRTSSDLFLEHADTIISQDVVDTIGYSEVENHFADIVKKDLEY